MQYVYYAPAVEGGALSAYRDTSVCLSVEWRSCRIGAQLPRL